MSTSYVLYICLDKKAYYFLIIEFKELRNMDGGFRIQNIFKNIEKIKFVKISNKQEEVSVTIIM